MKKIILIVNLLLIILFLGREIDTKQEKNIAIEKKNDTWYVDPGGAGS